MDELVIRKVRNGFIVTPRVSDYSVPRPEGIYVFETTKAMFFHIQALSDEADVKQEKNDYPLKSVGDDLPIQDPGQDIAHREH